VPKTHAVRPVATLDSIVSATRRLLAQKDYRNISMRAVAAAAGVTAGAIYRYFPSKEALVDHVVHATLEEYEVEMLRVISKLRPGSFDRVIALGHAYIRLAGEKPEHFKILFTPVKPARSKLSELPGQGGFRLLRECIAEAMEAGEIRSGDPDLAAFFLWSRVHGIATLLMACDFGECLPLPREEQTSLRLFELSREFLWKGFQPVDSQGAS
jgi:AcrR family transcriptional regulator